MTADPGQPGDVQAPDEQAPDDGPARSDQDPAAADTRTAILHAARRLFGERGYGAVTIREVAREAGVSPALVMKIAGSKERLHAEAAPLEPTPLGPEVPIDGLGELLVRRMLMRRDDNVSEPWVRALYLVQDAPDSSSAREEFRDRFLQRYRLGGPEAHRRADLLACLMIGLGAGIRTLRLVPAEETDQEAVITEYGALVQQVLDSLPDAAQSP